MEPMVWILGGLALLLVVVAVRARQNRLSGRAKRTKPKGKAARRKAKAPAPDEAERSGAELPASPRQLYLVRQLLLLSAREAGYSVLAAADAAEALGIEKREKLTVGQSRRICEAAGHLGYCVEPDARLTGKAYRSEERLAAYLSAREESLDPGVYSAAACMLRLGLLVAMADGQVNQRELELLDEQLREVFSLNSQVLRRLHGLRLVLIEQPPQLSQLCRLAAKLPEARREAVGRFLLSLAAVDGEVGQRELEVVRSCLGRLGFRPEQAERALAPLMPRPEPEAPKKADAMPVFRLDRSAVAAIMRETREVAAILAEAMKVEEDENPEPIGDVAEVAAPVAAATMTTEAGDGPPPRYASLYVALVSKPEWTIDEAECLARKHGHMLSGAVEALNEWAIERRGATVFFEDGERLVVESKDEA